MIIENFPIYHVVVPLLAAAFCAMMRSSHVAWLMAFLATIMSFCVCVGLIMQVSGGEISYFMGGWGVPDGYDYAVGIEYKIDKLNSFVLLLISFVGMVMMPYAKRSVESEIVQSKRSLFYAMYLLCFAGLLGIVSTADVFNIYVFLEISSLATYVLIALGKDRRSLTASYEYLIIGTIGATFILIGIGFLYMMTGTLNLAEISQRLNVTTEGSQVVEAAFAFITLGLAMKIALFPLHIWLTNAYAYAPSFVSAFLASTATKVMLYVFIRVVYTLFGYDFAFVHMPLTEILVTLAVMGIVVGSVTAIYQPNVKRMLAFSSVAQLGYMALALGLATELGLTASIVHLANHALAKGLLFLCVGAVCYRVGGTRIEHFAGVAKYMPWTMAAFVLGGFSLIGLPLTAGFISKWVLLQALVEKGWWALVALLLVSSIMAVIYIWKVVEAAYFGKSSAKTKKAKEAPLMMLVSIWVLVVANVALGINTEMTLGFAADAANQLFYGGK